MLTVPIPHVPIANQRGGAEPGDTEFSVAEARSETLPASGEFFGGERARSHAGEHHAHREKKKALPASSS